MIKCCKHMGFIVYMFPYSAFTMGYMAHLIAIAYIIWVSYVHISHAPIHHRIYCYCLSSIPLFTHIYAHIDIQIHLFMRVYAAITHIYVIYSGAPAPISFLSLHISHHRSLLKMRSYKGIRTYQICERRVLLLFMMNSIYICPYTLRFTDGRRQNQGYYCYYLLLYHGIRLHRRFLAPQRYDCYCLRQIYMHRHTNTNG